VNNDGEAQAEVSKPGSTNRTCWHAIEGFDQGDRYEGRANRPAIPYPEDDRNGQLRQGAPFQEAKVRASHMQEALPVALGLLISIGAMRLSTRGSRLIAMVPACVLAGAAASAITGELSQNGWLFFVSADALLVWLGAAVGFTMLGAVRRVRAS